MLLLFTNDEHVYMSLKAILEVNRVPKLPIVTMRMTAVIDIPSHPRHRKRKVSTTYVALNSTVGHPVFAHKDKSVTWHKCFQLLLQLHMDYTSCSMNNFIRKGGNIGM